MKTTAVSLNLSRKWRSQNFDQIVGQDLSVRILKNSLYLGHYFPVYLFAGQRGCGKTSTARVFAAALNCEQLEAFQKDPKNITIPCLSCVSCKAMQEGKHPDFIEIDAASYTGVDHMRNIIESSSLLPIMGQKRIYLIDEAHMLSKAAFNAALKILEEPPASALFILATTNPHKIIETVRSRCFQLFFTPLAHDALKRHLKVICTRESIVCDDDALDIIIRHTQGSARDALNLLEQVRFASSRVDKNAVLRLLGHINDQHVLDLITITLSGSAEQLLHTFKNKAIESYDADFVWQRLMTLLRGLIWMKHGVSPALLVGSDDLLQDVVRSYSLADFHRMIQVLYEHEELFLKTPMQHALLEMILLQLCHKDKKSFDDSGNNGSAPCSVQVVSTDLLDEDEEIEEDDEEDESAKSSVSPVQDYQQLWTHFVEKVMGLNDPLLNSLFKRAHFYAYDEVAKKVTVEMAKDLILFKDLLDNAQATWQPLLRKVFLADVKLEAHFTGASVGIERIQKTSEKVQPVGVQPRPAVEPRVVKQSEKISQALPYKKRVQSSFKKDEIICDVSDKSKWKIASMLLQHFPGVVTEIRENR